MGPPQIDRFQLFCTIEITISASTKRTTYKGDMTKHHGRRAAHPLATCVIDRRDLNCTKSASEPNFDPGQNHCKNSNNRSFSANRKVTIGRRSIRSNFAGHVRSTKTKGSIKTRRKRAGWHPDFLLQVLQITRIPCYAFPPRLYGRASRDMVRFAATIYGSSSARPVTDWRNSSR
jgi:hypothetical protein